MRRAVLSALRLARDLAAFLSVLPAAFRASAEEERDSELLAREGGSHA